MSFAIPSFPLACNVWHNPSSNMNTLGVPSLVVQGNLANGRIAHVSPWIDHPPSIRQLSMSSSILFPKLTDIRDASSGFKPDVIECPAASGRFYWVAFWDDIAKGFPNEHRWAVCEKVWTYGSFAVYSWPSPCP